MRFTQETVGARVAVVLEALRACSQGDKGYDLISLRHEVDHSSLITTSIPHTPTVPVIDMGVG